MSFNRYISIYFCVNIPTKYIQTAVHVCVLVFRPLATSLHVLPIYGENSIFKEGYVRIANGYQLLIVIYFQQLRLWFIYYDIRKAKHLVSLKYLSQLKYKDYKHNLPWTLRYKKTLGNTTFMGIFTLFLSISVCFTMSVISYYDVFAAINLMMPASTLIFFIPLAMLSATLKDEIGIGREIRAICTLVVLFIGVYMVGEVLLWEDIYQKQKDCFVFFLWGPLTSIVFLRSVHVPSLKLRNASCLTELFQLFACFCRNNNEKQMDYIVNHNIQLNDVLKDQDLFDAFVTHCINEFSAENILYLVELYDLKFILKDNNIDHFDELCAEKKHDIWEMVMNKPIVKRGNGNKKKKLSISFKPSKPLPINVILDECIDHLVYLHQEYISNRAITVINISSKHRKRLNTATQNLSDKMESMDNDAKSRLICQVFLLHISCAKSIYNLLKNDTFQRFKQTKQFEILSQFMTK